MATYSGICIGIQGGSCGDHANIHWYTRCDPGYAYHSGREKIENKKRMHGVPEFNAGDTIQLLMNCKTRDIEIKKNSETIITFNNIKHDKYKLAIAMFGEGITKCTLVDSKIYSIQIIYGYVIVSCKEMNMDILSEDLINLIYKWY